MRFGKEAQELTQRLRLAWSSLHLQSETWLRSAD